MIGTLNYYLDPDLNYTWQQASTLAAKGAGRNVSYGRQIQIWIRQYLTNEALPKHQYGKAKPTILDDEDFSYQLQVHLVQVVKCGYIKAQDIANYMQKPEAVTKLAEVGKDTISIWTARCWLHRFNWRYTWKKNGMYIDGHKCIDVVKYRKGFIQRWKTLYEPRFTIYDNEGNATPPENGFPIPPEQVGRFQLILVMHNESTFYENDRRKSKWTHLAEKASTEKKGEGQSIMVSDFVTPDWGRLTHDGEESCIFFKAGKNRDGYFTSEDLISQVDIAINIFEAKTRRFKTALFLFDNAPSHQKWAPDALSAHQMVKQTHASWRHHKGGPKMRSTMFTWPDGQAVHQDFYFPDDHPTMPRWFKGMEIIIRERGLWPAAGLNAQCEGFKCQQGQTDCCSRRVLFEQPDFQNQKSQLEELITSRGHICDFYPKYHCKLNFIEQYWGAAKLQYRNTPKTSNIDEMEENVHQALDSVTLAQIRCYSNHAARFLDSYDQGLTGPEAVWANKKYHGHCTLPLEIEPQG
ncbi:hypothetical protein FA15DRAFT_604020 [Coprinopsis marcescibilis]|uniref:Uncharacterized protein n=1 Tax=Coprinopsis marcescibilis TaxID=230819 RepID=A0A5C3KDB2_COPMA|nr:hypothetical protein FA15DRAFT_604020 [Coprinopsis marcescibilis]